MAAIELGATICVVDPGIVVDVVPDDYGGRGAHMAKCGRWWYYWSFHPRVDTHRLAPVVGGEVGARACDSIGGQGRAEV